MFRLPHDNRMVHLQNDIFQYMRIAATNGNALAQFRLGEQYFHGVQGQPQNFNRAAFHFFQAGSLPAANLRLGEMFTCVPCNPAPSGAVAQ